MLNALNKTQIITDALINGTSYREENKAVMLNIITDNKLILKLDHHSY